MKYRKFARTDVAAAHRLSLEVGWPHRLEDWKFVQRLGTGHVATDGPSVVGTILTWKHDARHASLGMVIVSPERQGRGIGRELMKRALRDVTRRSVMLNATEAGQPLYEKLGFVAAGTIEQHQGIAGPVPAVALGRGERLRPIGTSDAPALAALATRGAGMSRARVLKPLLVLAKGIALARDDEILGFALFRRFGRGYSIGPVVAPDAERAKILIGHWVAMHPGKFLRIDVDGSSALASWLDGIGLGNAGRVITMVKGKAPRRDPGAQAFAIVSQALG
ncbi:MAG TPA: GNAT family N-acetyltransferase [Usitatibacter sp.]|nr:GNAT family N-acetyltransferase [Usitatibacter sp.]